VQDRTYQLKKKDAQESLKKEEMLLQELSQILAAAGISASQEEKILTAIKNIPVLWEVIENQKFHEPHLEDLEALI
jgi:hypothetical protein